MNIALSGSTKTAIALKVSAAATITTSANVALDSSTGLNLILEKGSEGSLIKVSGNAAAVSLKIQNKTESNMTVHTFTGTVTISKNSSRDITVSAPSASGSSVSGVSTSGGSSSGSSSSGGSSSGGSSSDGSSSGGSSSGGSSSDDSSSGGSESEDNKTDAEPKGITVDQTYITMKEGEVQELYFSADPKEAGRLININYSFFNGRRTDSTYIYKDGEKEPIGIKITAKYAGIGGIYLSADVIGNEENSPVILPRQSKVTIIRITKDGAEDAPVSEIKLTTESASVEKGDSVHASVQLNAPEGAKLTNVRFIETANVCGVLLIDDDSVEETTAGCRITGDAKGNDELVALAIVELPDGTKEEIVSNVVQLKVTDSSPDPSAEETEVSLHASVSSLQADERCRIVAEMGVHANSARILKVRWTSSDPQVIRVNQEEVDGAYGALIGESLGKATINAEVTIVTSSQTFTKTASLELDVKPDFALKITPSVHVVTGSAIEADGWAEQDRGKAAFELFNDRNKVLLTPSNLYGSADNMDFDSFIVNTQEQIDGLRIVELPDGAGYGFVIQDENITNQTFQIPVGVITKTYITQKVSNYTTVVTVTVEKDADGELSAIYEVGDVQRADP